MKKALFIPLAFLLLFACDDKPVFPNVPEISFISITPSESQQYTADGIELIFHYQDGDGDLGYVGDRVSNLFIVDARPAFASNPIVTAYSFESLTPTTRKPSIQGEMKVLLSTPPYDPIRREPLVFNVYIVDRAGNSSNVIETTPITINP